MTAKTHSKKSNVKHLSKRKLKTKKEKQVAEPKSIVMKKDGYLTKCQGAAENWERNLTSEN